MNDNKTNSNNHQLNLKQKTINLVLWTGAWLLTTALAAFGSKYIWEYDTILSLAAALLNVVVGLGMVWANKRHLDGLDELMRRIQLEAMAISFGLTLVVGLSYEQLAQIQIISYEPEFSQMVIFMALTYVISVFFGNRKYS